jgi:dienelactone hydrolase
MGAASAEYLALTRPGARGLLMIHGVIDPRWFDGIPWPSIPAQVHMARNDPFDTPEDVDAVARAASGAGGGCEVFWYDRGGHLFTDPQSSDYDEAGARLVRERVIAFLDALDGSS